MELDVAGDGRDRPSIFLPLRTLSLTPSLLTVFFDPAPPNARSARPALRAEKQPCGLPVPTPKNRLSRIRGMRTGQKRHCGGLSGSPGAARLNEKRGIAPLPSAVRESRGGCLGGSGTPRLAPGGTTPPPPLAQAERERERAAGSGRADLNPRGSSGVRPTGQKSGRNGRRGPVQA